jgi:hypothetical protein
VQHIETILNNLKKKEIKMNDTMLLCSVLVLTLLNLGLVILALGRLSGLRKDLRTPVVKKFNTDFKRKPIDIPKSPENFGKSQRDDKSQQGRGGNQSIRPKNNQQQNRQMQIRRPAAKAPDVFSNEMPAQQAPAPIPPRPTAPDTTPAAEGRRPLPPRYNAAANNSFGTAPADLAPLAPAPVSPVANEDDAGMEFDRTKIAHGRRNMVSKPVIEDDGTET